MLASNHVLCFQPYGPHLHFLHHHDHHPVLAVDPVFAQHQRHPPRELIKTGTWLILRFSSITRHKWRTRLGDREGVDTHQEVLALFLLLVDARRELSTQVHRKRVRFWMLNSPVWSSTGLCPDAVLAISPRRHVVVEIVLFPRQESCSTQGPDRWLS